MDRISDLPPPIIHHIMSYLYPNDVARTCVLSKRWSYLRALFPILDFDQRDYLGDVWGEDIADERFYELTLKFVEFVNTALHRFCRLKVRMWKFRIVIDMGHVQANLLDRWISMAVGHEVEDLVVEVRKTRVGLYNLPQTIFNAKSITTLKVRGCKLEQSSDGLRLCFLKSLTLDKVHISEQMIQKFTSECPLLEEFSFFLCRGIKCFCISKLLKLKTLHIKQDLRTDHPESIKVAVPSLQQFILELYGQQSESLVIDLSGCLHLNDLVLKGDFFKNREFHNLISKFPMLQKLSVDCCHWLERTIISSNQLKELSIGFCSKLKAIDVDTPNLLSFKYMYNPVPIFLINAPCPWTVAFDNARADNVDVDANWYLNIKEFLRASNQIYKLFIYECSSMATFNLEDIQYYPPLPPCRVESLSLIPGKLPANYASLLDCTFWICHPKFLHVDGWFINKFIKWLYWELRNKNVYCCNSLRTKCWRHYLKDFVVKGSLRNEDVEPVDIDNLPDDQYFHSEKKFRFCLEWLLPQCDSIKVGSCG